MYTERKSFKSWIMDKTTTEENDSRHEKIFRTEKVYESLSSE